MISFSDCSFLVCRNTSAYSLFLVFFLNLKFKKVVSTGYFKKQIRIPLSLKYSLEQTLLSLIYILLYIFTMHICTKKHLPLGRITIYFVCILTYLFFTLCLLKAAEYLVVQMYYTISFLLMSI